MWAIKCIRSAISGFCEGAPCFSLHHVARAVHLEILSPGVPHLEDHSGKNAVYRNHRVTPTKTNRLATIIVSLVRGQARFGFCQGILTSQFKKAQVIAFLRQHDAN
jgi:hypothetical protein